MTVITIGNAATARTLQNLTVGLRTFIDLNNPANASGKITQVILRSGDVAWINNLRLGLFYLVSGTTYKCRSSTGNLTPPGINEAKSYSGLSLDVVAEDVIGGFVDTGGQGCCDNSGGAGFLRYLGEAIDPGDQAAYTLSANFITSIGGTGETPAPAGGGPVQAITAGVI
jgi:hypothetical protein